MTPPTPDSQEIEAPSADTLLPIIHSQQLDDYTLDIRWSSDGQTLAATPSTGRITTWHRPTSTTHHLPPHQGGNGTAAWHPHHPTLATIGHDATLRIHDLTDHTTRQTQLPSGWTERCEWNADGTLIAIAIGKSLHILHAATLETVIIISDHPSTVTDLTWHPTLPNQIATASDGGARIWRLGEEKPFARIDDGVAALQTTWSPDGRWVVTTDQTPSLHLYDLKKRTPLFIQGFHTKIRATAWQTGGTKDLPWLALGGGPLITLWPCFGKKGPRNAHPIELAGHIKEVTALHFPTHTPYLASGARDGLVLLWLPHQARTPALIARKESEITTIRWSPDGAHLAYGTAQGHLAIHQLNTQE